MYFRILAIVFIVIKLFLHAAFVSAQVELDDAVKEKTLLSIIEEFLDDADTKEKSDADIPVGSPQEISESDLWKLYSSTGIRPKASVQPTYEESSKQNISVKTKPSNQKLENRNNVAPKPIATETPEQATLVTQSVPQNKSSDKTITCSTTQISKCTNELICSRATYKNAKTGETKWIGLSSAYTKEAMMRKINCGVTPSRTCGSDTLSICSPQELCERATWKHSQTGQVNWQTNSKNVFLKEAKKRKLSCNISNEQTITSNRVTGNDKKVSYSLGHGATPICDKGYNGRCIGSEVFSKGKYVGIFNVGTYYGPGFQEFDNGEIYLGIFIYGSRAGPFLYVWKNGAALFVENWEYGKEYRSNSDTNKVFPYLANRFNSLTVDQRKKLQVSLFNKGFYSAKIDGVWGRSTLTAFAKFSLFYLNSVDMRRHEHVEAVLDGTYSQMVGTYVVPASKETLDSISNAKHRADNLSESLIGVEKEYKSLNNTNRKQVQWVLKQLGLYEASIDGTWGPKTMQAMTKYLNSYGFYKVQHETIYSSILSEMPVPTSFVRPQNNSRNKNSNDAGANLLKLLIVGGLCSATPDPSACLAGAANVMSGNSSDNSYRQTSRRSSLKDYQTNSQCRSDVDCGAGSQCVSRLGKSMCVKLVDNYGRRIPTVNAEPSQCRSNGDCPRNFSCDRQLRVCLKR